VCGYRGRKEGKGSMIVKQYLDVITGAKTQTRRLKDNYQVGKVYSVVPKMYKPSVWWRFYDGKFDVALDVIEYRPTFDAHHSEMDYHNTTRIDHRELYSERGYIPLKIRITDKRHECLQDITDADATAEGIKPAFSFVGYYCEISGHYITAKTPSGVYIGLWDAINTKKGTRWEDNPMVYVYTFEVVK
jgi:hypothetical protein